MAATHPGRASYGFSARPWLSNPCEGFLFRCYPDHTDGGEEVRSLTELVTPEAEHVLDWFHIAMRLTVLEQYARGVAHHDADEGARLLDPARRPPAAANPHPCLGWHAPAIVRSMAPGAVQRQPGQRQSGRSGVNAPTLSHGLQVSLRLLWEGIAAKVGKEACNQALVWLWTRQRPFLM